MALVQKSVEVSVGTITLDHREKHNALSSALISDLLEALASLTTSGARVVILRASRGAKVWSAGHDVRELPTNGRDPLTYNDPLRRVVRAIKEAPLPVIAMVEGGVWGGACELVMSCDMVIAAEGATFAITPAKLGVPYDIAGVLNFMRSVSLPIVKELLFTAQPMPAARALQVGIVNQVFPDDRLEAATAELAAQITRNSPLTIGLLKEEEDRADEGGIRSWRLPAIRLSPRLPARRPSVTTQRRVSGSWSWTRAGRWSASGAASATPCGRRSPPRPRSSRPLRRRAAASLPRSAGGGT
jgi:methylmalonyl-CoA decarboxylase